MDVVYSIGVPFNYGGMGEIAYHAALGLYQRGMLTKILTPHFRECDIPRDKFATFPFGKITGKIHSRIGNYSLKDNIFDLWASKNIEKIGKIDAFYGWAHHSLMSIRVAHRKGSITFIDRGSAEIRAQRDMLIREFKKVGLNVLPISEKIVRKAILEADETDFVVVPSTFVRNTFIDAGYPEEKIILNPLGVDLERFAPKNDRPKDDVFRVIYMGILSIQKGVHYLIQAWKKLNIHDGELLLVGSFEKLSKKIISTEAKGTERVVFRGGTATPEREFKKSDIFAFPSNQDGFGSVVLEAMACGLPVIVSENTGAKDCVRDGIDGFIVPAADVDALCDRINYFYKNRDKVREMGRRAREQALKYDWESYRK
ncbi:hypothetical protein HKBW3C_03030, partial [Candidatus Hakubella thermalkaliphila]